jgi:hypothetical protein
LPDTLRGLVAARIDGLTTDERGPLEDASVWGRSGPIEALERMAEQVRSVNDVSPVVAGLVDKEILIVSGRRWSFRCRTRCARTSLEREHLQRRVERAIHGGTIRVSGAAPDLRWDLPLFSCIRDRYV